MKIYIKITWLSAELQQTIGNECVGKVQATDNGRDETVSSTWPTALQRLTVCISRCHWRWHCGQWSTRRRAGEHHRGYWSCVDLNLTVHFTLQWTTAADMYNNAPCISNINYKVQCYNEWKWIVMFTGIHDFIRKWLKYLYWKIIVSFIVQQ